MLKKIQSDPFGFGGGQFKGYSVAQETDTIDWFKGKRRSKRGDGGSHQEPLISILNKDRLKFWLVILLFGLIVLLGRLFYLQLMQGQYYKAIAEGNRVRIYTVKASRGVFYDRNQTLLVKNVPNFSLAVIPVDLPGGNDKLQEVIDYLAKSSELETKAVEELINQQPRYSYQPIVIKENLNFDEALKAKITSNHYPGVVLKIDSSRQYLTTPATPSLSHLLGYTGKISEPELDSYLAAGYAFDDYVGKTGLELSYEKILKGQNGKEHVEVDALGETKKVLAYQKPIAGKNLILTIDSELQEQAESSLERALNTYGKKRGLVIVLDPNNGEVLAMVNLPAFNNNLFTSLSDPQALSDLFNNLNQPLFPRSISGEYPSGSTFKMIVAAAALEEGLITSQTGFNSVGGLAINQWFFPDWKAGGHGWTSLIKALAESVNTFFYIIGGGYKEIEGLGVEKIKQHAQEFGLNQKLGIDLPNEAAGLLPDPEWKERVKDEQWYIGDTYHLAIGQGDILVTPLQVAAWTSVFANNGTLYQPHLVKGVITNEEGDIEEVEEIKYNILNQNFIDSSYINLVNQGLRQAVVTGSARGLGGLPIQVAAKTGTAQWSSQGSPHAWITAFAPYKNPEIVVTVLVEEGGEGSTVALPVASDLIYWWSQNR